MIAKAETTKNGYKNIDVSISWEAQKIDITVTESQPGVYFEYPARDLKDAIRIYESINIE